MKCPNCGAEMKDGLLYCEQCGEDIHIVPDFETEVEYNLEQTLNDIVNDINGQESVPVNSEQVVPENVSDNMEQDWDGGEAVTAKDKSRHAPIWLIGLGIVLAIIGTAVGVAVYRLNSVDYQVDRAEYYTAEEDYERAVSHYNRALELTPDSIELKFALAEVYFLKNNKVEYEYLLHEIINDKNSTAQHLESAYGKLIAIYRAREDYETINDLLRSSGNESIMSIYQSYLALEPEFSVQEGYYTSIQPLKLTTFGTGKIYYTMDGSEPDANSQLYTAPLLLEGGDYCIKAIYINENNISSNIVTKNYHVEIENLPTPEISVVSGDYQHPMNIEVVSEAEDEIVYYTTDGSTPTEDSTMYTGPIPMPLGTSVFKFIRIEEGKSSQIVERSYNLKLNTSLTTHDAAIAVLQYSIKIGKIYDEEGHFDESNCTYSYKYMYVTTINKNDFYIISESISDENNVSTGTGNYFAVNVYSKEIFQLLKDEQNNYVLVEIEKGAR